LSFWSTSSLLYTTLLPYHSFSNRSLFNSPELPIKGIGRFFSTSTTYLLYPPAVYRYQSRVHPQIYEDCFQTSKHSSIIQLIDSRESISTLTKVHRFQNTPVARLHASMNSMGRNVNGWSTGMTSGTTEHSNITPAMSMASRRRMQYPATFEHQAIPYSSAGEEVVSAGAGAVFCRNSSSAPPRVAGLASHQSSMPIVYTKLSTAGHSVERPSLTHRACDPFPVCLNASKPSNGTSTEKPRSPGIFEGRGTRDDLCQAFRVCLTRIPKTVCHEIILSMAFQNTGKE
jgi:hypothetical protein